MDPNEIIKHAPEIAKTAGAVAGAIKLTDVIKAFLGPATGEIAERFKDEVRIYRYERQLAALKKAEKMTKDAGFTPKAVPIKLLFPLLEGASLEEDEDLHTMWAALLANASDPNGKTVHVAYTTILREMMPDDAKLLAEATTWVKDAKPDITGQVLIDEVFPFVNMGNDIGFTHVAEDGGKKLDYHRYFHAIDNLVRLRLFAYWAPEAVRRVLDSRFGGSVKTPARHEEERLVFTRLGIQFLESCQPPKKH